VELPERIAVAQLNPPSYRKPSDISYILHGWLKVYREGDRKTIDDWIKMDSDAGIPCHEYQKRGEGIWYASSLTVDPLFQGTGIGTAFITLWEEFIRGCEGKDLVFFTNSEKNLAYYLHRGFEVFHEQEFIYDGKIGTGNLRSHAGKIIFNMTVICIEFIRCIYSG
jgi:GNAT superfamily N-acetyltransferase